MQSEERVLDSLGKDPDALHPQPPPHAASLLVQLVSAFRQSGMPLEVVTKAECEEELNSVPVRRCRLESRRKSPPP